jgi:hypothetical protein
MSQVNKRRAAQSDCGPTLPHPHGGRGFVVVMAGRRKTRCHGVQVSKIYECNRKVRHLRLCTEAIQLTSLAAPWLRQLCTGLSRVRARVKPCRACRGGRGEGLVQVFSEYFGLSCQSFHQPLHTHHPSSGTGAIGRRVADVLNWLKLTPPQETKWKFTHWLLSAEVWVQFRWLRARFVLVKVTLEQFFYAFILFFLANHHFTIASFLTIMSSVSKLKGSFLAQRLAGWLWSRVFKFV